MLYVEQLVTQLFRPECSEDGPLRTARRCGRNLLVSLVFFEVLLRSLGSTSRG